MKINTAINTVWKTVVKSTLCLVLALIAFLGSSHNEIVFAQSCEAINNQLRSAIASCSRLNSNSACYGNGPAFVSPLEADFDAPGEQQLITVLQVIQTSPTTGAVVMLLQLATAESPVKVILFGGSELTPEVGGDSLFTLQGGGNELCPLSPSGMVVRTETGEQGILTVNGVEIELGSAAYIVMTGANSMIIANLEGRVAVTIDGQRQEIPIAYQSEVVGIGSGQVTFVGPPSPSPLFGSEVGQFLATGVEGLRQVSEAINEPSLVAACGGTITFGQTVTAQITTPGQECLYTFCSLEGRAASINLERVDATADPWLALRAPGGELLKFNDDINEQNINSRICNSALPSVGCYTIVARFNDNNTGVFRLSLSQQTACALPVPRCEVITTGLNQREGPGLEFPVIRTLPQGTPLRPLEGSADRLWLRALVAGTSLEGWVSTSSQFLACEDAIPGPSTTEPTVVPASVTPEVEPEPTRVSKEGPFGGP